MLRATDSYSLLGTVPCLFLKVKPLQLYVYIKYRIQYRNMHTTHNINNKAAHKICRLINFMNDFAGVRMRIFTYYYEHRFLYAVRMVYVTSDP